MNYLIGHLVGDYLLQNDFMAQNKKRSTFPCLVHVGLYTVAIALFTGWPWWALAIVAATHFAQDRTQVIGWWMRTVGQGDFAKPPLGPWSIIVVDNVWHLVTLFAIDFAVHAS